MAKGKSVTNLLDPSILFFIFGIFAGLVKSNLEIPQPISRFLSLLDMGLIAARSIGEIKGKPPIALLYALIAPPTHALQVHLILLCRRSCVMPCLKSIRHFIWECRSALHFR